MKNETGIPAMIEGASAGFGIAAISLSFWGKSMMSDPNLYGPAFAVTCGVMLVAYLAFRLR